MPSSSCQRQQPKAVDQVPHRRDQALLIHRTLLHLHDLTRDQALLQTDTALAPLIQQEAHEAAIQATEEATLQVHDLEALLHIRLDDHHLADPRLHMEQALDQQLRVLEVLRHTEDLRHLTELLHEEALLTHHLLGLHQVQDILLADHHIHQEGEEATQAIEADIHLAHHMVADLHTADHVEAILQAAHHTAADEADIHQADEEASVVAAEAHEAADADSISMSINS